MSREFKDNTIEISDRVKKIIKKKYRLYRRLVHAFPKIKENVLYSKWDDMKKRIEESKEEIACKIDTSKEEIRNKLNNSKEEIKGMIDTSKKNIKKVSKKKDTQ
jgi:Ser-tRNA(Ala) deacylase AlaX